MTLDRYVLRLLLVRTISAIVVLMALVQVLELLEVTSTLFERGLGFAGVGHYTLLRIPGMFEQVSALGMLVGAIFTFTHLARTSEMVVIRATGANIYRLLKMMAPVAIGVAALDFVVASEIAPRSQEELSHWMAATAPATQAKPIKPHWFRLGRELIMVGQASDDGRQLKDVHIYRRDASSNLTEEISAASATAQAGGWRLRAATTLRVGQDRTAPSAPQDLDWRTNLGAGDVVRLYREGERVSAGAAATALARAAPTDRSPGYYITRVNRTFAEPLAALVMLLLSAPAALSSLRSDQAMRLFVFGLSSGILFMVADGMLTALGETNALPPVLAAWSAPVAFSALAITVLLYAEG
jgi:lipopolysaccharide export system permease protein